MLNSCAQRAQKPLWAQNNCRVWKQSGYEGRLRFWGFFPRGICSQPRLDPEHQVGWIPAPVRAAAATFLCHEENIQMSMIYGCCNFGTTAAGSYLERKDFPITFYLKNLKGPLQFSITSCGITKIGILPLSYVIHPLFSSHICYCRFSFKQKGGKTRALGKNWLLHT